MADMHTITLPHYGNDRAPVVRNLRRKWYEGKITDLEFWREDATWYAQWYDNQPDTAGLLLIKALQNRR